MISKNDIEKATSEQLAIKVVIYRMLKINKNDAIQCMQEIEKRRAVGDSFDYDGFIKAELAKSPKPDTKNLETVKKIIKQNTPKL